MSFADRHFLLSQDNWVVGTQDLERKNATLLWRQVLINPIMFTIHIGSFSWPDSLVRRDLNDGDCDCRMAG